jgi:hypothetical protein
MYTTGSGTHDGVSIWHRRSRTREGRSSDGVEPGHTPRPRVGRRVRMLLSFQRPSHLSGRGFLPMAHPEPSPIRERTGEYSARTAKLGGLRSRTSLSHHLAHRASWLRRHPEARPLAGPPASGEALGPEKVVAGRSRAVRGQARSPRDCPHSRVRSGATAGKLAAEPSESAFTERRVGECGLSRGMAQDRPAAPRAQAGGTRTAATHRGPNPQPTRTPQPRPRTRTRWAARRAAGPSRSAGGADRRSRSAPPAATSRA